MGAAKTGWSRAAEWYAAGLFLLYAVLVFAHAGAPSLTDYANWTYQGVLLREHLLGHADAAHTLKPYPVPNSTTTVGIGVLALVLPWLLAAKTWLAVQLGCCWLAMRFLLRTVDAPAVAWIVVPQAVFLNVNFWYGFMNFELGLAWVMVFAALLLRGARPLLLAVVLALAFLTHMIPFCCCVLLLLAHSWQTGQWRRVWASAPTLLLMLWYIVGRFLLAGNADGQAGMHETAQTYSAAFWLFKLNSYLKSFGFVNPLGAGEAALGRAGLVTLFVAEILLALLVAWGLVRGASAVRSQHRFISVALLILFPIFLLLPGAALGVSDPGARVLQTGLALGIALCWEGGGPKVRCVAAACGLLLTAGGVWLFLLYGGALGSVPHAAPGSERPIARFTHVPNTDQDYFYGALDRGDLSLPVFPTGMLLSKTAKPPR